MLFKWMPVPGRNTPPPTPFDTLSAATIPSESTTLMWVVPLVATGPLTWALSHAVVSTRASAIARASG